MGTHRMQRQVLIVLLVASSWAIPGHAAPVAPMTFNAMLQDTSDSPRVGTYTITVKLVRDIFPEELVWSDTKTYTMTDGRFQVQLFGSTTVDDSELAGGNVRLRFALDSFELYPSFHLTYPPQPFVPGQPVNGRWTGGPHKIYAGLAIPSFAVTYACSGFASPANQALSLPGKSNRTIPLKAAIVNGTTSIDPGALAAPPVVSVSFASPDPNAVAATAAPATTEAATGGNQFVYLPETRTWQHNLSTAAYSARGTYTVRMTSGDPNAYILSPECATSFVRN